MTHTFIAPDRFEDLFDGIERTAWRWECQGHYAIDAGEIDAWRAGGGQRGNADDLAWRDYIRALLARGGRFERARILPEPLTEYVRYQLDTTAWNVDHGEDIRWITQTAARELGMPDYDFYILDDNRVAILHFDEAKEMLGVTVDRDPAVLRRHQSWRAAVWDVAVPHAEYFASYRSV